MDSKTAERVITLQRHEAKQSYFSFHKIMFTIMLDVILLLLLAGTSSCFIIPKTFTLQRSSVASEKKNNDLINSDTEDNKMKYQHLVEAIREMPLHSDAQRIFHGRGGLYPGCEDLSLDWYCPVFVLTSFREIAQEDLRMLGDNLEARYEQLSPGEPFNWVYQWRLGVETQTKLMTGEVAYQHVVTENGFKYIVRVLHGRNCGLFLDVATGRQWVKEHTQGKKVLSLFSYTCAFSVAALKGGAMEVINIDMSQGALKTGQRNHNLNEVEAGARFLNHNIFKTWGKINKLGPYDVIVVDPPSYQKGSFAAKKDYIKLLRRLPSLLSPGGHAVLCLNAPELNTEFWHSQVADAAPELKFTERLPNPQSFPARDN